MSKQEELNRMRSLSIANEFFTFLEGVIEVEKSDSLFSVSEALLSYNKEKSLVSQCELTCFVQKLNMKISNHLFYLLNEHLLRFTQEEEKELDYEVE